MSTPNRNTYYARVFVDALARAGLEAVCIAPGSRSTPLTLAFAEHDGIRKYTHLDERSAGFFALGLAMASDKPVALVCTSGTAAANVFPAIIEAKMSRVPLLILTADRPHELRHSGANQTIDQVKLYGDNVLWSVDMALPESNPPAVAVRNLAAMAARALATADGRMDFRRKGPVHLNFPFRKPLEPVEVAGEVVEVENRQPLPAPNLYSDAHTPQKPSEGVRSLNRALQKLPNGIVVCGPRSNPNLRDAVRAFANAVGYPIFADPLSGYRYSPAEANVITAYDTVSLDLLLAIGQPQVLIRLGDVPTSANLNRYLAQVTPQYRVHIADDGVWADDSHTATHMLDGRSGLFDNWVKQPFSGWQVQWRMLERRHRETLQSALGAAYFDGAVVPRVVERLPHGAVLFVGNSNPVRHLDQFAPPSEKLLHVYGARGASGIDGQVSTALGVGAATGQHVTAIVGDITFYHDMNGLLAVRRHNLSATFVVINNDGGGIFERLPIREFEPHHTDYFLTPHGLIFEHAAAMYGLDYACADDFASLDAALTAHLKPGHSAIIEVKTDIKTDEARHRELVQLVNEQIRNR